MKKAALLIVFLTFVLSCKNEQKSPDYKDEDLNVTTSIYPDPISKVFDAHGGIDIWNRFNGMYYEIEKPVFNERHTINLKSRKSVINAEHFMLGFDGTGVWLKEIDSVTFKKNPRFSYNLMFYFYAMPFILGDDGINYSKAPSLQWEGIDYPGILISYEAGIGESPEDEYILYYHPVSYEMTWLAYTVTYFSNEKSKEFHFIKYNDWQTVEGVYLPQTLQWYNYENNQPTKLRNTVRFVNVKLTDHIPDDQIFESVEGAKIIE
jgi:hypothetical protein